MFQITGWRYYWRRYLCWFPIQFCMVCGKWYWGGIPYPSFYMISQGHFWQWLPCWMDYCSTQCCIEDMDATEAAYGGKTDHITHGPGGPCIERDHPDEDAPDAPLFCTECGDDLSYEEQVSAADGYCALCDQCREAKRRRESEEGRNT